MSGGAGGRRFHVKLEREVLPVVVHVTEEHATWYTEQRHAELVSLIPEILGDLLKELADKKKVGDAVRVKEDVFRGANMELRCFFRSTQPLYHVLVPGAPTPNGALGALQSANATSLHSLYITASPHP